VKAKVVTGDDLAKIAIFRQFEKGEAGGSRWSKVAESLNPFGGRLGKWRKRP
jgi:hypothetical protein